ncbi:MAG TPA: ABC transporter permease [Caldilineaceae bacterium]|nr:ABC transporter permease [Caldilineaceae bacterium]
MRTLFRFLADNKRFLVGLILFLIVCLLALFQPLLVRWRLGDISPMTTGTYPLYVDPNPENLLGTDRMGRDVFSVLMVGLRYSLAIGLLAGSIATLLGILVGFIAGFQGGRIDSALRTFTDMFLVIPTFPILVTLSAYLRGMNVVTMAILLAIFSWPFSARAIRSQVLSLRERGYVDLARVSGLGSMEIIFQEILPNLLPYLGVGLAVSTVGAILAEVGLEVIGLGPGNVATLGLMINWAIGWGAMSLGKWHLIAAPAGALVILFFALNLMNIGLEEAFNPRLKGTTGQ